MNPCANFGWRSEAALLVARLGIPSFVVSLAYFLGLQGAMLLIIGEGGTIPIRDDAILSVMNDNMPVVLGWLFGLIVIAGFALATLMRIRARKKEGLPTEAMSVWAVGMRTQSLEFVRLSPSIAV